ncbi:hypothetical protein BpHYR1_041160 [Brachionus plicatilis]|uniref:Uncharacterized protein n=1 Tax=Brachionus plicatilis TaxID=10195 RepID=A0A3M7PEB1_BRAPC|nr:hypothetical protein BpHYR1_041160 [Brachionus plicatilis]
MVRNRRFTESTAFYRIKKNYFFRSETEIKMAFESKRYFKKINYGLFNFRVNVLLYVEEKQFFLIRTTINNQAESCKSNHFLIEMGNFPNLVNSNHDKDINFVLQIVKILIFQQIFPLLLTLYHSIKYEGQDDKH